MNDAESESQLVAQLTQVQLSLRLYVQSLLPGDPAAADVAQQANATAWQKRAEFTPGTNFKAWLFAIARFETLNYRKRQARDARLVFGAEVEELLGGEVEEMEELTDRRREALRGCLTKLRDVDRALLLHRYTDTAGTLADYADQSGRSVGGLKVTLHRLRNALLRCVEEQLAKKGARA
jgi:RNA polymerase sigma-70 factor, ECF subfamily